MASYLQDSFSFPVQHQQQMYYPGVTYPDYLLQPQHPLDDYHASFGMAEYADFMAPGMLNDEFGEGEEVSTRPRLTKEQVEILEAQFQANHKPNSQVKRQLAIQTNLKFQRVGNWFQNRRAKAKQQKRQEEFEAQNGSQKQPESKETPSAGTPKRETQAETRAEAASPMRSVPSPSKRSQSSAQNSPSPVRLTDRFKEASWASLQRALGQAKAAQNKQPTQPKVTMPPPELPPQSVPMQLPLRMNGHHPSFSASSLPTWPNQPPSAAPYPSPMTLQDTSFDFGFDTEPSNTSSQGTDSNDAMADFIHDSFVVTPEDWQEPLATPKGMPQQQNDPSNTLPSPGLTMPSYPSSRRESATDDLSNNFGNFALVSSSPTVRTHRRASELIRPPQSGALDIAARRKRPRPAALTSTSLRSRSYGALTSVSPTFRQGVMNTPPVPHTVRHVKSAGHSLNSRYAGVRKSSSAQRSPMCVASFAEAEAFNQLMAQQAINAQTLAELPAPSLSPDLVADTQMNDPEKNPFRARNINPMLATQNLSGTTASPPGSPMMGTSMMRGLSQQSLCPPASAPAHYSSFQDYTPPYSAGPLTNSSWSDAALTSPEMPSFPSVSYVPSLGYAGLSDGLHGQYHHAVLPSDHKSDLTYDAQLDRRQTEFYIQEFPNQKEEHANIAQHLSQQKPRNYVFANSAPQDYAGP
ncbi:hypothetical protein A1O1_04236 [Capronia coronata CBS 617.96]|uniref:Homeobox domain-containing protein n=1 Tax=Capronia coronata CBS 617.96 TaxID=1182541 RepID=W9YE18_9EURO|nr:uncharacterized protein A1O1_04236 [Capronia coronata CBS 617.96]EXJ91127.1 hypothetical protein A1O1_04236 [Capronia coronata CBS 617.96]